MNMSGSDLKLNWALRTSDILLDDFQLQPILDETSPIWIKLKLNCYIIHSHRNNL